MQKFMVKYSRAYEREVQAETLDEAGERAKKICDNTTDCKLLAVWPVEKKPEEVM